MGSPWRARGGRGMGSGRAGRQAKRRSAWGHRDACGPPPPPCARPCASVPSDGGGGASAVGRREALRASAAVWVRHGCIAVRADAPRRGRSHARVVPQRREVERLGERPVGHRARCPGARATEAARDRPSPGPTACSARRAGLAGVGGRDLVRTRTGEAVFQALHRHPAQHTAPTRSRRPGTHQSEARSARTAPATMGASGPMGSANGVGFAAQSASSAARIVSTSWGEVGRHHTSSSKRFSGCFEDLLEPCGEARADSTIDDAVIEAVGEVRHLAHHDLIVRDRRPGAS